MVPSVQGDLVSRAALASEPCQHCAIAALPMALTALQRLCTSHFLGNPVSVVPWTSQPPIPLPAAQLVQTSPPAGWWTQPSLLCTARGVHGLFCSYSFAVKLKQAVKEKKIFVALYTQTSEVTCIYRRTNQNLRQDPKWKMFGLHHIPAEPQPLPRWLPAPQQVSEQRQQKLEAGRGG